jgi:paired amphipathic helix protein Sin3a
MMALIKQVRRLGACGVKDVAEQMEQVQTIWSDSKCRELWSLLQAAQASDMVSRQDIVRYRREAELHVGQDENLYKLQWVSAKLVWMDAHE